MTTIIDGTAGITFPVVAGGTSAVQASSGKVLQVVNATYATYTTTTSTSLIATGLTANITPSSTTSKILVVCSIAGAGENASGSNNSAHFEIYRNGSSVSYFDDIFGYGTTGLNATTSISWQDSPASTSALTYAIYWKRAGGGAGTIYINNYVTSANQTVSSLTLMEIAA